MKPELSNQAQNHSLSGRVAQDSYKVAIASLLGIVLSYAFVFLAALPLRYLRLTYGRNAFFASSVLGFATLLAMQLWQWSMVYFSLCFLIGVYRELEEKQFSIFLASTVTVLATAGTNLFVFFGYTKFTGQSMRLLLIEKATPVYEQFKQMPRFSDFNLDQMIWFLPSGLIITLMFVVFVSLTVNKHTDLRAYEQSQLRQFRLPDWLIWAFMGGLAASILDYGMPALNVIGSNVLFICLAAYFFQGLAVFTHFLDRLRIYGFWRMLAYFLIFFQLFIFVSGLGILDFWFDFRATQISDNKKINI